MRPFPFLAAALLTVAVSASPAFAQAPPTRVLQLAFLADGTVSLTAQHVSVREILAEWARQCGCYVVNWDKLTGGPLTIPLQFEKTPQASVLESLLRQAAGYVLTPKRPGSQTVSNYETIYIVATSTAVAGNYVPPVVAPSPIMPMPTPGSPEDEIPAVNNQPPRPTPPGQAAQPPQLPPSVAPGVVAPGSQTGSRTMGTTQSVLVPIVPVNSSPSTTGSPAGTATAPPPMPVPAPPQAR